MDTITHGIVGALTAKAFFAGSASRPPAVPGGALRTDWAPAGRAAIVACTLGATFPDIDVFAGPIAGNPLAMLEWHRGLTHSVVALPLWALLLAAMAGPLARWMKWESPGFWGRATIFGAGIGTHILLDVVTNFGTMVWSPLDYRRVAWDWLFILDFTFTAIALVPQLAGWCYRDPESFRLRAAVTWMLLTLGAVGVYALAGRVGFGFSIWAVGVASAILATVLFAPAVRGAGLLWSRAAWSRAGFALLCIYLGVAGLAHRTALETVEGYAASRGIEAEKIAALPLPPNPTHWVGLMTTQEGVWRSLFRVPSGRPESATIYASTRRDPYIEQARKLPDVQAYLRFAAFPVWRVERSADKTVVEITDVRFFRQQSQELQRPRRLSGGSFTFAVVFDAAGALVSHGFREPDP